MFPSSWCQNGGERGAERVLHPPSVETWANEKGGGGCPPPGINTEVDEVAGGIPHLLESKQGQTKEVETLERERHVAMERNGEVPPEQH